MNENVNVVEKMNTPKRPFGKQKKFIVIGVVVLTAACTISVSAYYSRFNLKQDTIKVELGENLSTIPKTYVSASEKMLQKTKVDFSKVNVAQAGIYKATVTNGTKTLDFNVEIKDTQNPELKLKAVDAGYYQVLINTPLKGVDIIESIADGAGIKTVAFADHQVAIEADATAADYKEFISTIGLQYDVAGEQKNTITVFDASGNQSTQEIIVYVVEDLVAHVSGIQDMTVEQNATIDFMKDVTNDDKVASVMADTSAVKMDTPGEYTVTYTITGTDAKATVVTKAAKVTVVDVATSQAAADNGGTVYTSEGAKAPSPKQSYNNSKNTGTGSNNNSTGKKQSSGSSSGGNARKEYTPGQTWEGTKTGEGYIGGGDASTGSSTWESFTW